MRRANEVPGFGPFYPNREAAIRGEVVGPLLAAGAEVAGLDLDAIGDWAVAYCPNVRAWGPARMDFGSQRGDR